MSETASPASALLPHPLSWHGAWAWLNLKPAATRPVWPPGFLYKCLRGEACVRGPRWSQRAGDESDEHLSGDVISSERWWPAPAVFGAVRHTLQHLSEGVSACTSAGREQGRYSQGFHNSPVMKSTEVKRGRQYISSRAWFFTASVA